MSNCLGGNAFTRNIWIHEALPSTSCDLCTCKVWSCYGQWLRICITKKIHHLTLTPRSRSQKMLPSTSDFLWPLHQQNLMLLHLMVMEKMNLQENTLFDLDLGVKVIQKLPSTFDIMWPMHQQSLILLHPTVKEKMNLKEIHYLTLTFGSRSQKMLPSALYIMWPMHLQNLKLLCQKL